MPIFEPWPKCWRCGNAAHAAVHLRGDMTEPYFKPVCIEHDPNGPINPYKFADPEWVCPIYVVERVNDAGMG